MHTPIFKNERKVKAIGGRLESDYYRLRESVLYINANYIPLFFMLGINHPDDRDLIIDTLGDSDLIFRRIKEAYILRITELFAKGELQLESLLSARVIRKQFATSEERERYIVREIHRASSFRYKEIYNRFMSEFRPSYLSYYKTPLKICREAIEVSSQGLEIDVDKYIMIYRKFIEADESNARRCHQEAANAINRFFNGSVEITHEELERYFIIKDGVVKPNIDSITIEDYMRLGYRGFGKSK